MVRKERFLIAEYKNVELKTQDAVKLRGFFADLDESDSIMHNHQQTGENIYRYPMVQYKVLHHHPFLIAYADGISALYPKLMQIDALQLGGVVYPEPDLQIRLETRLIGDSECRRSYRFLTPWLALNQENYRKYGELSEEAQRTELLERILTGNILSLCKGFGVKLERQIQVSTDLKSVPVRYKGESMRGFVGGFEVNARLPGLCGIGKGVSRGMGTIGAGRDSDKEEEQC